jgi:hypothetical protein
MITNDTHNCPACGVSGVPHAMLACRTDWYRLPGEVRSAVWLGYRNQWRDGGAAHRAAMAAASKWWREHPVRRAAP